MEVLKEEGRVLPSKFYNRPTLEVAADLIGKYLVRRLKDGTERALMIHETEAYDGFDDKASHARRGLTPRTEVMYGPPGIFYVYFCYGIHWLLNVVAGPDKYPAAVLIRGAGDYAGPARLTKALSITGAHNRTPATFREELWIEDRGRRPAPGEISRTPRIGIDYAGAEWAAKPYRFLLEGRGGAIRRRRGP